MYGERMDFFYLNKAKSFASKWNETRQLTPKRQIDWRQVLIHSIELELNTSSKV